MGIAGFLMGIFASICGIVACASANSYSPSVGLVIAMLIIALILGILGIIFSAIGIKRRNKKAMAIIGLVLSIIAVIFVFIVFIIAGGILCAASNTIRYYY